MFFHKRILRKQLNYYFSLDEPSQLILIPSTAAWLAVWMRIQVFALSLHSRQPAVKRAHNADSK